MNNINQLLAVASKNGFNSYGSFNEGELQHDTLTCLKGRYNGEVIDIYYDYNTGSVTSVEYSTQFKGQESTFRFDLKLDSDPLPCESIFN